MIRSVLLDGNLTKDKLDRAYEEICKVTGTSPLESRISVIISSTEGDAIAAVSFIERIAENDALVDDFGIKVYQASSTAAFIALALTEWGWIEMAKDAVFGIHRGEIRLSPSQINPDGKIDDCLISDFKKYDTALTQVLERTGLARDKNLMAKLHATDWLRLPAEECMRRGFVQKLF